MNQDDERRKSYRPASIDDLDLDLDLDPDIDADAGTRAHVLDEQKRRDRVPMVNARAPNRTINVTSRALAIVVVIGALLVPGSALADMRKPKDEEAMRLFVEGNRDYKVKDFDAAIAHYKESIKIEESQAALYNIAQAYRQSGDYESALWFYRRLLGTAKLGKKDRAKVDGFIDAMEAELEKQAASQPPLEPEGDGKTDGPETVATEDAQTSDGTTPTLPSPAVAVDLARPAPWYADGLGWSLTSGGGVLSTVALVLVLNADGIQADANSEPDEIIRAQLQSRAESRRTWAAVTGLVGVGLLAAGVTRLILVPDEPGRPATIGVSIGPGSLYIAGRF